MFACVRSFVCACVYAVCVCVCVRSFVCVCVCMCVCVCVCVRSFVWVWVYIIYTKFDILLDQFFKNISSKAIVSGDTFFGSQLNARKLETVSIVCSEQTIKTGDILFTSANLKEFKHFFLHLFKYFINDANNM